MEKSDTAYRPTWWAMLVRGMLAIGLGLVMLGWPGIGLSALVVVFGVYAIVDGVWALGFAVSRRHGEQPLWLLILEGLAGIGAGIAVFLWPQISAVMLLFLIATWALVTGVLELGAAFVVPRGLFAAELFFGGIVSMLLGILMLARPAAGALALAWLIGLYGIFFGVLLISWSFRLRGVTHALQSPQRPATV